MLALLSRDWMTPEDMQAAMTPLRLELEELRREFDDLVT